MDKSHKTTARKSSAARPEPVVKGGSKPPKDPFIVYADDSDENYTDEDTDDTEFDEEEDDLPVPTSNQTHTTSNVIMSKVVTKHAPPKPQPASNGPPLKLSVMQNKDGTRSVVPSSNNKVVSNTPVSVPQTSLPIPKLLPLPTTTTSNSAKRPVTAMTISKPGQSALSSLFSTAPKQPPQQPTNVNDGSDSDDVSDYSELEDQAVEEPLQLDSFMNGKPPSNKPVVAKPVIPQGGPTFKSASQTKLQVKPTSPPKPSATVLPPPTSEKKAVRFTSAVQVKEIPSVDSKPPVAPSLLKSIRGQQLVSSSDSEDDDDDDEEDVVEDEPEESIETILARARALAKETNDKNKAIGTAKASKPVVPAPSAIAALPKSAIPIAPVSKFLPKFTPVSKTDVYNTPPVAAKSSVPSFPKESIMNTPNIPLAPPIFIPPPVKIEAGSRVAPVPIPIVQPKSLTDHPSLVLSKQSRRASSKKHNPDFVTKFDSDSDDETKKTSDKPIIQPVVPAAPKPVVMPSSAPITFGSAWSSLGALGVGLEPVPSAVKKNKIPKFNAPTPKYLPKPEKSAKPDLSSLIPTKSESLQQTKQDLEDSDFEGESGDDAGNNASFLDKPRGRSVGGIQAPSQNPLDLLYSYYPQLLDPPNDENSAPLDIDIDGVIAAQICENMAKPPPFLLEAAKVEKARALQAKRDLESGRPPPVVPEPVPVKRSEDWRKVYAQFLPPSVKPDFLPPPPPPKPQLVTENGSPIKQRPPLQARMVYSNKRSKEAMEAEKAERERLKALEDEEAGFFDYNPIQKCLVPGCNGRFLNATKYLTLPITVPNLLKAWLRAINIDPQTHPKRLKSAKMCVTHFKDSKFIPGSEDHVLPILVPRTQGRIEPPVFNNPELRLDPDRTIYEADEFDSPVKKEPEEPSGETKVKDEIDDNKDNKNDSKPPTPVGSNENFEPKANMSDEQWAKFTVDANAKSDKKEQSKTNPHAPQTLAARSLLAQIEKVWVLLECGLFDYSMGAKPMKKDAKKVTDDDLEKDLQQFLTTDDWLALTECDLPVDVIFGYEKACYTLGLNIARTIWLSDVRNSLREKADETKSLTDTKHFEICQTVLDKYLLPMYKEDFLTPPGPNIECRHCDFDTLSPLVADFHKRAPHFISSCRIFCVLCDEIQNAYAGGFRRHMVEDHGLYPAMEKPPTMHDCKLCLYSTLAPSQLIEHESKCMVKFRVDRNQEPSWNQDRSEIVSLRTAGGNKRPIPRYTVPKQFLTNPQYSKVVKVLTKFGLRPANFAKKAPQSTIQYVDNVVDENMNEEEANENNLSDASIFCRQENVDIPVVDLTSLHEPKRSLTTTDGSLTSSTTALLASSKRAKTASFQDMLKAKAAGMSVDDFLASQEQEKKEKTGAAEIPSGLQPIGSGAAFNMTEPGPKVPQPEGAPKPQYPSRSGPVTGMGSGSSFVRSKDAGRSFYVVPDDIRRQIVEAWLTPGGDYLAIGDRHGISRPTVYYILRKYNQTGEFRAVRKAKVDDEILEFVKTYKEKNPKASHNEVNIQLRIALPNKPTISLGTVARLIDEISSGQITQRLSVKAQRRPLANASNDSLAPLPNPNEKDPSAPGFWPFPKKRGVGNADKEGEEGSDEDATNATGPPTFVAAVSHSAVVHKMLLFCELCDVLVQDRESLRNHFFWIHATGVPIVVMSKDQYGQTCPKCEQQFWTPTGLERHQAMIPVDLEGVEIPDAPCGWQLEEPTMCLICNKIHQTPQETICHVFNDHRLVPKHMLESKTCLFCSRHFASADAARNHLKAGHHITWLSSVNTSVKGNPDTFYVSYCSEQVCEVTEVLTQSQPKRRGPQFGHGAMRGRGGGGGYMRSTGGRRRFGSRAGRPKGGSTRTSTADGPEFDDDYRPIPLRRAGRRGRPAGRHSHHVPTHSHVSHAPPAPTNVMLAEGTRRKRKVPAKFRDRYDSDTDTEVSDF